MAKIIIRENKNINMCSIISYCNVRVIVHPFFCSWPHVLINITSYVFSGVPFSIPLDPFPLRYSGHIRPGEDPVLDLEPAGGIMYLIRPVSTSGFPRRTWNTLLSLLPPEPDPR